MEDLLKKMIMPHYEAMLHQVIEKSALVPFCLQWGKNFPVDKQTGILFVGKATNGWVTVSKDIKVLFGNSKDRIFARDDQMEWVHNLAGKKANDPKGYNTHKSAFWRIIKKVAQSVNGNEEWYSKIAWSNLYKISFEKGNPNERLKRNQLEFCKRILEEEIKILSPRYVVFLTSDWDREFIKYLSKDLPVEKTDTILWGKGFKTKAHYSDGITYISSQHPQGKNESEHVKVILNLMKN